jgi:SAM-dependent methyltransferase
LVTFLRKQGPDILITELLDAEWRIAESNALIEDQRQLIEKLAYEGHEEFVPLYAVDTVLMTWTLCSIADPLAALREMRRVLKPDGKLLFVEHGLSPGPGIERWQHRLTPIWCHVAGGCHLDRQMDDLTRSAGFDMTRLRTEYAHGPRPMTYMYLGCAQLAD